MTQYVGFTVGPIFDTISDATSPARLWFASYTFSDLVRRLCKALLRSPLENVQILSPFYDKSDDGTDAVGKYHDRVIMSTSTSGDALSTALNEVVDQVKAKTLDDFPEEGAGSPADELAYLSRYLQVHYVICPADAFEGGWYQGFATLNGLLDSVELMRTFPADEAHSPFARVFRKPPERRDLRTYDANRLVRESPLFKQMRDKSQLCKPNGSIRDLASIAADGRDVSADGSKKVRYFAVVNADGDNMGAFFRNNVRDASSQLRVSQALMRHATSAAAEIGTFGGMTIYAGGDDLLFLAPVENSKGQSVFQLCEDLAEEFRATLREAFREKGELPTLSFGISVQFYKAPLYEALARARELLAAAKDNGKDRMMVGLQKHSGQTHRLSVPNGSFATFKTLYELAQPLDNATTSIRALVRTLRLFETAFGVLDAHASDMPAEAYVRAWGNFFDNENQPDTKEFAEKVAGTFRDEFVLGSCGIAAVGDDPDLRTLDSPLDALIELLLIRRFMDEKVGEDELRGDVA